MMKNDVRVRVKVAGRDELFTLSLSSSASFVLYRCLSHFNIKECRYFALFHSENPDDPNCVETVFEGNAKLKSLKHPSSSVVRCIDLRLGTMCYPFCVTHVSDLNAVNLIYQSVQEDFLNNKFEGASFDDAMYLAACTLKIEFGTPSPETCLEAFRRLKVAPAVFVEQHVKGKEEMFMQVMSDWFQKVADWSPMKCYLKYIKRAESLSQYGIHYFEGVNKVGERVHLGIEGFGLRVFRETNKTCARTSVSWCDVMQVHVKKTKFCIKTYRKDNIFLADRAITFARHRIARKVLQYCMLHHQFYLLFCHQSENTRKSVRLVRRLEQLGIASSPAKKELGLDSLKEVISSDDSFYTNDLLANERLQKMTDADNSVFSEEKPQKGPQLEVDDLNLYSPLATTSHAVQKQNMNDFRLDEKHGNNGRSHLHAEESNSNEKGVVNDVASTSKSALPAAHLNNEQEPSRKPLREIGNVVTGQNATLMSRESETDDSTFFNPRKVLFPNSLSSKFCDSFPLLEVTQADDVDGGENSSSFDASNLNLLSQIETRESYYEGLVEGVGQESTYTLGRKVKRTMSVRPNFSYRGTKTAESSHRCEDEENQPTEVAPSRSLRSRGKHCRTLSSFSGCSNRPKEPLVSTCASGSTFEEKITIRRYIKSGNTKLRVNMFERLSNEATRTTPYKFSPPTPDSS